MVTPPHHQTHLCKHVLQLHRLVVSICCGSSGVPLAVAGPLNQLRLVQQLSQQRQERGDTVQSQPPESAQTT